MLSLVGSPFTREAEQKVENTQNNEEHVEHKGHSYSRGSNELPNSEEIVKKILEQEKNEYQKNQHELESKKSPFAKLLKKQDSHWQDQEELYLEIEKWISENSDKIPSWQVAGPLNYAMSLEQMRNIIVKKFKEMAFSGNLITEEQLTKKNNREIFYPTTDRGGNNLTRIWGAEFLKSNLVDDTTLNAAEHFFNC